MELQTIIDILGKYLPIATTIVTACAAIAAMTPTKVDDRVVQFFLDIINFCGMNFGKARNKDA